MDKQYAQSGKITVANPAAAVTVALGFKPRYVRAVNVNNVVTYEHWTGMDDGTSFDTATELSLNAAGAITLTANGFTLGLDICDTAADVVYWVAFR